MTNTPLAWEEWMINIVAKVPAHTESSERWWEQRITCESRNAIADNNLKVGTHWPMSHCFVADGWVHRQVTVRHTWICKITIIVQLRRTVNRQHVVSHRFQTLATNISIMSVVTYLSYAKNVVIHFDHKEKPEVEILVYKKFKQQVEKHNIHVYRTWSRQAE